jgi:hypothetical protein
VLAPLMKHESRNATGELKHLLNKSKSSLVREPHRITNQENNSLDIIFDKCYKLKIAYDLKNKLFNILHSRNLQHDKFIDTINEWCDEAKSAGIESLVDFSVSLRGYKVVK